MARRLSMNNIRRAAETIDPAFLNSPQYESPPLSEALGARVIVKLETANPIRCFKGRGADFFVAGLGREQRVICASAGNFGQAMAYSCGKRGIPLTVYAAANANTLKIERMRALGAEVTLFGADLDEAKLEAKRVAAETGARMVEDGLDIPISEGAGTIGLELAEWPEKIHAALIAVGNGALIGGVGRALKESSPEARVVGVAARGAPSMEISWRTREVVETEKVETIADGIGIRIPIPEAVGDMVDLADDVLLVDDSSMIEAMRLAHRHLGVVVEPAGVVGLAALLENPDMFAGQSVATVLCGGNLTESQTREWLG